MPTITRIEFEDFSEDWRDIPLFLDYEINSQRVVRQKSTGRVLRDSPWGSRAIVSIFDAEAGKTRRVDTQLLWELATCPAEMVRRYELRVRPDIVYHNLLSDCLQRLGDPAVVSSLSPKDMLQLLKFLESLKAPQKSVKNRVVSINAMRRYAQKLEEDDDSEGAGDSGTGRD